MTETEIQAGGAAADVALAPRRPRVWIDVLLGVVLAGLALTLCLTFLRDPLGHDDRRIFIHAERLLAGARGAEAFSTTHYRIGFVLEHALAQLVLGYTATAYYTIALFNSVMVVVAIFFLGRVLLPRWPAVLIALVFASNPYYLNSASWAQIDWPSAWRFMVGLALAVLAFRRSTLVARTRYTCAIFAGLFFWWSFYTKASAAPLLAMVPTLLIFVPFDRKSWVAVGLTALSAAVGMGVGFGLDYLFMGDVFAMYSKVQEAHTYRFSKTLYLDRGLLPSDLTWGDLLLRYPRLYWAQTPGRVFLLATALAAVIAVISRSRPLLLFLAFGLAFWAAISLMVTNLDPLAPVLRTKDRYFVASYGFFFLLCGGSAYVVYRWVRDRRLRGRFARALFTVVTVASVFGLVSWQVRYIAENPLGYNVAKRAKWEHQRVFLDISAAAQAGVAGQPVERLITDGRMAALAQMFLPESVEVVRFDPGGRHFKFQAVEDYPPGSLVYLHHGRINSNERKYYDNEAPDFIHAPPSHWLAVFRRGDHEVYYVLDRGALEKSERASGWSVLQHLHARLQKGGGTIERTLAAPVVRFELNAVADGRLALGPQHYTDRPPRAIGDGALYLESPGFVHVVVRLRSTGEVEAEYGRLVVFTRSAEMPKLHPMSVKRAAAGEVELRALFPVEPKGGEEAFNVMIYVTGTGTVTVEGIVLSDAEIAGDGRGAWEGAAGFAGLARTAKILRVYP